MWQMLQYLSLSGVLLVRCHALVQHWLKGVQTWDHLCCCTCFSAEWMQTPGVSCFPRETCCDLALGVRNWTGYTGTGFKLYMGNQKKKAKKSSPILSIEVVLLFRDDKMDKGEKEVSVIQWGQQRILKVEQCFHCFNTSFASPLKDPNDKDTEGFFLFAICFPSNKYTSCTVRIPSLSLSLSFFKIKTCQGCIQCLQ